MNEPSTSQQQPQPPQSQLNTSAGGRPRPPQYPLLSEMPIQQGERMPQNNPVDRVTLTRATPQVDPDEPIEKDLRPIITESNDRLVWSLDQSRHQRAVQQELKALLEHERKILLQVQDRALKFLSMREDNKKKIDEWEVDHKQRMSFYTQFLKQLMEVPEDECLTQEGVPVTVAQKILYNIVEKTANIANNAVVQLSMQITVVNDIDLNLGQLRQFCAVTLKQIDSWLKNLNTQIDQQDKVIELWDGVRQKIKSLKDLKGNVSGRHVPAGQLQTLETRVSRLENAMGGVHQGSENVVPTHSEQPPQQSAADKPPCLQLNPPPLPQSPRSCHDPRERGHQSHEDNGGGGRVPTNQSPPPQQPQPPHSSQPPCADPDGRGQQRHQDNAGGGGMPPLHPPQHSAPPYGVPPYCPPCPPCPPYFPYPFCPPCPPCPPFYPYPFCPPCPPEGYPIYPGNVEDNIEANEQHDCPEFEEGQQVARELDPALIPMIQGDLQQLSKRNKKLEELVSNFRQMRALLTEEMDKAVNLNQKLQKDLHYVAREANKGPQ